MKNWNSYKNCLELNEIYLNYCIKIIIWGCSNFFTSTKKQANLLCNLQFENVIWDILFIKIQKKLKFIP